MARPGQTLENPVTGERLVFVQTSADSDGAVCAFSYFLPAGGSVPLAHVHPRQQERFEIVAGRAKVRVGRRLLRAEAGESVAVPRGTLHRLWNDGEDELHALVEFRLRCEPRKASNSSSGSRRMASSRSAAFLGRCSSPSWRGSTGTRHSSRSCPPSCSRR